MDEWQVVLVIATLVGLVVSIGAPILKLNTSIAKLDATMGQRAQELDQLDEENSRAHERIYNRLDEKGKLLAAHETQLKDHERRLNKLDGGK